MSNPRAISRRLAVGLGAAATLPLVHIRTVGAAGKLSVGFWDHWVPGANLVMQKQVDAWAEKNKVEVTADFIASSGGKLQLTPAAETQARTGHDVMTFETWDVQNYGALVHSAGLAHDARSLPPLPRFRCRTNTTMIAATTSRRWRSRSGTGRNMKPACAGAAA